MNFDKDEVIRYFVDNLKNKYLLPKPHLCVLNTKHPEDKKNNIFTFSDRPTSQNLIGYNFWVRKSNRDAVVKTTFEFWVRNGMIHGSKKATDKDFIPIKAEMITEIFNKKSILIISDLRSGEILSEKYMQIKMENDKYFFEYIWEKEFQVEYKRIGKDDAEIAINKIKILFKKNLKEEGDIIKFQVRISNENYNDELKGIDSTIEKEIPDRDRASLAVLLDFKIYESCKDANFEKKENKWGSNTSLIRVYNLVAQRETDNELLFSEYYVGTENIPEFKYGHKNKQEFINSLKNDGIELHQEVVDSFKFPRFYKYQEEGILHILREMKDRKNQINVIQIRTAGGKTETFSVPLLEYCLQNRYKRGVKSLIFYPTKALANDQAYRIFKALYFLNKYLQDRKIKIGLYHGDVKKSFDDEKEIWIPFKCPRCEEEKKDVPLSFKQTGTKNIAYCINCKEEFDFLILTRYEIHKELPDIVITNQDTLHQTMMNNPERHSIFGRKVEYCNKCGKSFINEKDCPFCHNKLESIVPEVYPDIIIIDEIHMLGGAFGINTALFLKRLNKLIRTYSNNNYSPVYISATATIKEPVDFVTNLFDNSNVRVIPNNANDVYDSSKSEHNRSHIFILPKSFNSAETLAYGAGFILDYFEKNDIKDRPRILGFCESIKDNRSLIRITKLRSPKNRRFYIGGHTSQFEKDRRIEIEKEFTRKEIDVLYATSTLEVGVDFDDVNILFLHGVPYSFNDFLQRVGRSGRKKSAAVITTLRNWSVLDYFYFERSKDMLQNPDKFIVNPPINKDNDVLLRNHIEAAFFDYLSSLTNANKIIKIYDLKKFIFVDLEYSPLILENIKKYITECFSLKDQEKLTEIMNEIKTEILKSTQIQDTRGLFEFFDLKHQIGQLRTSDKSVEVSFIV